MKLKPAAKAVLFILLAGAIIGTWWYYTMSPWAIVKTTEKQSVTIDKIDLPDAPSNAQSTVRKSSIPSDDFSTSVQNSQKISWNLWAWNAHMGVMFANGGVSTTKNSIAEKYKINLDLIRQEDIPKMQQDLIKTALSHKNNGTKSGTLFVSIMGDGAPSFLAAVQPELEKLGHDYRAVIFHTVGKSYGEDVFMGLPQWKADPQSAKGAEIAAYLRDGDWNIVVKWASDNGIPINFDERTHDDLAINFISADNYIEAGNLYINGVSSEKELVISGKKTGIKKSFVPNGVATWTPGDVNVATKKGGLVRILSTKENSSQMACVVIGINKWLEDNREYTKSFIKATGEGSDQVKSYSDALDFAGKVSAKVYNENDGKYWVDYYKGQTISDKTGLVVDLGGSRVSNISDNLQLFGLAEGSTNVYKIVYNTFGNICVKAYPEVMSSFPNIDDVLNLSFLKEVSSEGKGTFASADEVKFSDQNITNTVAKKSWSIEFETGKSTFTESAKKELDKLFDDLVIGGTLKVEIHGHTDNVGNPDKNYELSVARANAIKEYLQSRSINNFPNSRVGVYGHGQDEPIASNSNSDGRAKNRRVEIVMGK